MGRDLLRILGACFVSVILIGIILIMLGWLYKVCTIAFWVVVGMFVGIAVYTMVNAVVDELS